jgi:hypothetical protein
MQDLELVSLMPPSYWILPLRALCLNLRANANANRKLHLRLALCLPCRSEALSVRGSTVERIHRALGSIQNPH